MRPLQDLRVIAIEQYGAGPFGTRQLADLGAEVIKIEDPRTGGDVGRYVPPYAVGEDSLFFETFNRNKRSVSLDLKTDAGRAVFEDLVQISDAVFSNLRGDVPEKMRIRYADLCHLNEAIVCCSLTGFGMSGPRAAEPGYDYLLQALGGWMMLTGEPDAPPTKTGPSLVDFSGGLIAAFALLAGVHSARRTGIGTDCDVSLFETALTMLGYLTTWQLNEDYEPQRTRHSAHPSLVPFQAFPAADGWIVVACPKEKFWRRLARAINRPELLDDERFASFEDRRQNAAALIPLLEAVLATRTVASWLDKLSGAGVPCAPVQSVGEALTDAHTAAREALVDVPHDRFGNVRHVASPVRLGEGRSRYRRAPQRNQDFHYVTVQLLGYDPVRLKKLTDGGAFGPDVVPQMGR